MGKWPNQVQWLNQTFYECARQKELKQTMWGNLNDLFVLCGLITFWLGTICFNLNSKIVCVPPECWYCCCHYRHCCRRCRLWLCGRGCGCRHRLHTIFNVLWYVYVYIFFVWLANDDCQKNSNSNNNKHQQQQHIAF